MRNSDRLSRRAVLAAFAAAPIGIAQAQNKRIPIGLELYSLRENLKKDFAGTLQAVAKMGYDCVEFFASYFEWTPEYAKDVRKQLDTLGLRCYSTNNGLASFSGEGVKKAIELNKIIGSRYVVLSNPGKVTTLDGWKHTAEVLNEGNNQMKSAGLHAGYHNHDVEWKPIDNQRPIDLLTGQTDKSVMLEFDVGTCVEMQNDPVAFIEKNSGRVKSLHLKDWGPQKGYRVLFGEGVTPWKKIFAAAEKVGGVEFYLMEQEGSDYPETETAERCLVAYKSLHG